MNLLLVLLLSFNYNKYIITEYYNLISWIYLVLAILGHYFSLILAAGIILSPLLFIKNSKIRTLITAILVSLLIILMYIDIMVFHQYRFHLNGIVLSLFFAGQVIEFPMIMYLQITFYAILLIGIEYFIYYFIQLKIKRVKRMVFKKTLDVFYTMCTVFSYDTYLGFC